MRRLYRPLVSCPLLYIPDSPMSAHFYNEREKTIAVERLRVNRTGIKNTVLKFS
jgi:ACS family allantoate permease-like MFS transporter